MNDTVPIRILVDSGELHSGVVDEFNALDDVEIEVASLPKGDYWISGEIAVERKTVSDLIASIVEDRKRLFNQVRGIKDMGMRPIVLVEGGSLYDAFSEINETAIIGALSYLAVIEGVTVLRSENPSDTARFLYVMASHAQRGLGYDVPLRGSLKSNDLSTAQQYLLEGLPGIGPTLARALLGHFGSVRALFEADEDALCQVPGIGRERARRVIDLLEAAYDPGEQGIVDPASEW